MSARRTLVLDEAELLTTEAQNALLEGDRGAAGVVASCIIITSDLESIMPTILSRLQKIYFGTVPESGDRGVACGGEGAYRQAKAAALAKKALGKARARLAAAPR